MAASGSGIATFLVILFAGPICWAIYFTYLKYTRKETTFNTPEPEVLGNASEGTQADGSLRKDAEEEREVVSNVEYVLELLGYAIGIGNLWRFPYLVGKWGGCAFVMAYLVCLFFVAGPAYLFEMTWGHSLQQNTVEVFRTIHPRYIGLAWGEAIMLFCILAYYNVIIAYSAVYIIGSLNDPLPWADDSGSYWRNEVLNNYGGDYEGKALGPVEWKLAISNLFMWIIVFFSIAFGKHFLNKVTWVTVLAPVIMLFILIIRTSSLDGASDGVEFYIGKFDSDVLGDLDMWASACGQILFSLGPGLGTTITISSYARRKQDVFISCIQVVLANSSFSLIGGFAIFSIVGNIAYKYNEQHGAGSTTVADQAKAGPGLAFIAIADGMHTFGDGTNMMSVIFFMVLLTLGLDSTYAWAETFIDYTMSLMRHLKFTKLQSRYHWIVLVNCVVFYLIGLPFCTRMGNELLDVIDHYVAAYYLLFAVFVEAFMFSYDYKWERLVEAIREATVGNPKTPNGRELFPYYYWRFCLHFTMPVMTLFLFIYTFDADVQEEYGAYPDWCQGIGWTCLSFILFMTIVVGLLYSRGESSLPPIGGGSTKPSPPVKPPDSEAFDDV